MFKFIEYGWVLGGVLVAWVYRPLVNRIKVLETQVIDLKSQIPVTYVTKADLKESITEMKQSNKESLAEIKQTMGELKLTFERYTDKVIELLSHE